MAYSIIANNVSFVGGDFNMAVFQATEELRQRGIDATFLGSYAWRQADILHGEEVPQAGLAGCRYDSLGLYAIRPVTSFSRL